MKFNMPMAVFGGLALIAAAIYFGSGSAPASADGHDKVIKMALCEPTGTHCADVYNKGSHNDPARFIGVYFTQ